MNTSESVVPVVGMAVTKHYFHHNCSPATVVKVINKNQIRVQSDSWFKIPVKGKRMMAGPWKCWRNPKGLTHTYTRQADGRWLVGTSSKQTKEHGVHVTLGKRQYKDFLDQGVEECVEATAKDLEYFKR